MTVGVCTVGSGCSCIVVHVRLCGFVCLLLWVCVFVYVCVRARFVVWCLVCVVECARRRVVVWCVVVSCVWTDVVCMCGVLRRDVV